MLFAIILDTNSLCMKTYEEKKLYHEVTFYSNESIVPTCDLVGDC